MPDREGAYTVYAEPKDVKRAQDLVDKVNQADKKDRYDNYLEARDGVLTFILN